MSAHITPRIFLALYISVLKNFFSTQYDCMGKASKTYGLYNLYEIV